MINKHNFRFNIFIRIFNPKSYTLKLRFYWIFYWILYRIQPYSFKKIFLPMSPSYIHPWQNLFMFIFFWWKWIVSIINVNSSDWNLTLNFFLCFYSSNKFSWGQFPNVDWCIFQSSTGNFNWINYYKDSNQIHFNFIVKIPYVVDLHQANISNIKAKIKFNLCSECAS